MFLKVFVFCQNKAHISAMGT